MVKDAESHAEEDKKQKEEVEARNQTDSLCYSTEQTLAELGDKVSGDLKSKAESAIADAKKALEAPTSRLSRRPARLCSPSLRAR